MDKTLKQLWNSTNKMEFSFKKENGRISSLDRSVICGLAHLPDIGTVQIRPETDKFAISHKAPRNQKAIPAFVGKMCALINLWQCNEPILITVSRQKHKPNQGFARERDI